MTEVRAWEYDASQMINDAGRDLQDQSEEQLYSSFLIRCWCPSDGKYRIKVQHVQSGGWARTATSAAAVHRMETRCARVIPNPHVQGAIRGARDSKADYPACGYLHFSVRSSYVRRRGRKETDKRVNTAQVIVLDEHSIRR